MDFAAVAVYVLQGLCAIVVTILWTNFRDVKAKADKANEDLANYKLFVAEKYTTSEELREAVTAINRSFDQYSTKLDARLDRLEERILEARSR